MTRIRNHSSATNPTKASPQDAKRRPIPRSTRRPVFGQFLATFSWGPQEGDLLVFAYDSPCLVNHHPFPRRLNRELDDISECAAIRVTLLSKYWRITRIFCGCFSPLLHNGMNIQNSLPSVPARAHTCVFRHSIRRGHSQYASMHCQMR